MDLIKSGMPLIKPWRQKVPVSSPILSSLTSVGMVAAKGSELDQALPSLSEVKPENKGEGEGEEEDEDGGDGKKNRGRGTRKTGQSGVFEAQANPNKAKKRPDKPDLLADEFNPGTAAAPSESASGMASTPGSVGGLKGGVAGLRSSAHGGVDNINAQRRAWNRGPSSSPRPVKMTYATSWEAARRLYLLLDLGRHFEVTARERGQQGAYARIYGK